MIRTAFLTASLMSALVFGVANAQAQSAKPAPAGPKPAVSGVNGKVSVFGGSIDGYGGFGIDGALSVPLGPKFGAQFDGMLGYANNNDFWGAGAHLFWRDPSHALLGVFATAVNWNPVGLLVNKVGAEAEVYFGRLSVEGFVAAQSGDYSGVAGGGTVAFYLHDNVRIDGGYRYVQGVGAIGSAGAEWQHQNSGLAVFAKGNWGPSFNTVLGGVRFYAGKSKTLIQRQREDDPPTPEWNDLTIVVPPSTMDCM